MVKLSTAQKSAIPQMEFDALWWKSFQAKEKNKSWFGENHGWLCLSNEGIELREQTLYSIEIHLKFWSINSIQCLETYNSLHEPLQHHIARFFLPLLPGPTGIFAQNC